MLLSIACLIALQREQPLPLPPVVSSNRLADDSVTTYKLADGAVTAQKLAKGAVGHAALAPSAVTDEAISSGAVGERAIAANSVRSAHLTSEAISGRELMKGAVRREHVAAAAIGLHQLDTVALLHLTACNLSIAWGIVSADGVVIRSRGARVAVELLGVGVYALRWSPPFSAPPTVLVSATQYALCFSESDSELATTIVQCRRPGFSLARSQHGDAVGSISLERQDGEEAMSGFSFTAWD